jgi:DNA-binding response OmpR family regulator
MNRIAGLPNSESNRALDSVKVVMVTGLFDQVDNIRERAPGSDGFLAQPITLEGLAVTVSHLDHFAIAVVRC